MWEERSAAAVVTSHVTVRLENDIEGFRMEGELSAELKVTSL